VGPHTSEHLSGLGTKQTSWGGASTLPSGSPVLVLLFVITSLSSRGSYPSVFPNSSQTGLI
jgi:hypothetical protein